MTDQELVDRMQAVWASIRDACEGLSEQDWKRPTDCPGWSVQDHVSHMAGSESALLGRPVPDHTPGDLSHVRNPIGQANEVQVDYRRSWPGERVLEEFGELTAERLGAMRSWSEEDFSKESWTPIGPGTVRDFIGIRIFDAWVHEQDIRRALGRAGRLDGPVAEHAYGRLASAMPFVVGKKAAAPEGATVVFEISGPVGGTIAIGVEGGRAKRLDGVPPAATVRLSTDLETFNALGCGRWDAARALAEGRVKLEGDDGLGRTVLEQMNFMV